MFALSFVAALTSSTVAAQPASAQTPSASAESELVAYACFRNRASHICIATSDGSGERALGDATQQFNIGPVWSPDGKRLAYLCLWERQSGNAFLPTREIVDFGPVGFTRNSGGDVCVVGLSSTNATQIPGCAGLVAERADGRVQRRSALAADAHAAPMTLFSTAATSGILFAAAKGYVRAR